MLKELFFIKNGGKRGYEAPYVKDHRISLPHNLEVEDHPLSVVRYIRSYVSYLEAVSSFHDLNTHRAVVTWNHLICRKILIC
jgi:hypothetical protein